VAVLDLQPGEEAGIKSVTLEIRGQYAYGYLKAEKGVHRLVRISPFDAQSRRHTSFASVFVYPVVDDTIEIDIEDKDLRIDVPRVGRRRPARQQDELGHAHHARADEHRRACQNERSQFQNKETAMKMLRAALYSVSSKHARRSGQGRGGEDRHRRGATRSARTCSSRTRR
jgi:peptide chain release factor 2